MMFKHLHYVSLIICLLLGCDQWANNSGVSMNLETVLASCQKSLDVKDSQAAIQDCQFAEQWLKRAQPESLLHAESLEKFGDALITVNLKTTNNNYQQALVIREKLMDKSAASENLQIKLANSFSSLGKLAEAEIAFKKALHQTEDSKGQESLEVADVLNRLGVIQLQQQLLTDAEQTLRRALAIREAKLNAADTQLGETYNNLGFMYQLMDKKQDAESFYRKAVLNQEAAKEIPYAALYDSLSNLATLEQKNGKLQNSEVFFNKLLAVAEKSFGKDSPQYATGLNSLGMLALSSQNFAAAENLFNSALVIREKKLGSNHLLTAESANNLAVSLANQDKRAQAQPLIRYAAAVTLVGLGENNPLTQQRWASLRTLEGLGAGNIGSLAQQIRRLTKKAN